MLSLTSGHLQFSERSVSLGRSLINLEEQFSWGGLIYLSWNWSLFAQSSLWNQCFFSADSTWEALIWGLSVWEAFPINTNKGLPGWTSRATYFVIQSFNLTKNEFVFNSTLFQCDCSLYLIVNSFKVFYFFKLDLETEIFFSYKKIHFCTKGFDEDTFQVFNFCYLAHCFRIIINVHCVEEGRADFWVLMSYQV